MIIIHFSIEKHLLSLAEGYKQLGWLLSALENIYSTDRWHRVPRSVDERGSEWISYSDKEAYLRTVARDLGDNILRWPTLGDGFEVNLATAKSEEVWDKGNHTCLEFSPKSGNIQFDIYGGHQPAELCIIVVGIFSAVCGLVDVKYGRCDVTGTVLRANKYQEVAYSIDERVFPHREFLGWMGFVKRRIETWELPEADELIPATKGDGTIIVSVAEVFDLANRGHIEKAHRVEMRLVDLDALPVIDPRFL